MIIHQTRQYDSNIGSPCHEASNDSDCRGRLSRFVLPFQVLMLMVIMPELSIAANNLGTDAQSYRIVYGSDDTSTMFTVHAILLYCEYRISKYNTDNQYYSSNCCHSVERLLSICNNEPQIPHIENEKYGK